MKRSEPTQSVRIKQSDYDIIIALMKQEHLKTVSDAVTWVVHTACATQPKE